MAAFLSSQKDVTSTAGMTDRQKAKAARMQASKEATIAVNEKVDRAKGEMRERIDAYDVAIGHTTPLTPAAGSRATSVFWWFDTITIVTAAVLGCAFGGLELNAQWNQDPSTWRIYLGVIPIVYAFYWVLAVAGVGFTFANERFIKEEFAKMDGSDAAPNSDAYGNALKALKDRVNGAEEGNRLKLPYWNFPESRVGVTYLTTMTTLYAFIWGYLYQDLNTGDGTNLLTFNDERTFRVFIWMGTLLSFLNVVQWFVDWKELIHVGMSGEAKDVHACLDMHCELANSGKPGTHEDYPDLDLLMAWHAPVLWFSIPGTVTITTFLANQLAQGPSAFWAVSNWQVVAGVESIIAGAFMLSHMVGMFFTWKHKCAYKAAADGMWYWMVLFLGFGTVWIYLMNAASPAVLQYYESYMWVLLYFNVQHWFYTGFHEFRLMISITMQRVYCPNLYGF